MQHTLLFGGSFNPIHNGHIGLARWTLSQGIANEVWFMISPQNPLKKQTSLLDETKRLSLCRTAVSGEIGIEVSDFEFSLPRPSYTWDTLQALSQAYPNRTFSLLIGADNWVKFPHWAHHQDILRHHHLYIYPRQGFPIILDTLPACVHYLSEAPTFPYSATDIRQLIAKGSDITALVPTPIVSEVLRLYAQ